MATGLDAAAEVVEPEAYAGAGGFCPGSVLHSVLEARGLAARTVNSVRQTAVGFYAWCVQTRRAERNPLQVMHKQDESRDRRRARRPMTAEELGRLLSVAREHGREAWYLTAAFAGLRKGDLQRLIWRDVDFETGTITVRMGKARRVDVIPMHTQPCCRQFGLETQREKSAAREPALSPLTPPWAN